jgi:hypothetical protein
MNNQLLSFEQSFHLSNGKVLRSFNELVDYVKEMPTEVYNYHVNDLKNDFANWINDVINEPKLAKALQRVKKQETFAKKILDSYSKN